MIDERALRRRLREDLGSIAVPPAPVGAVLRRGAGIRARRRAVAGAIAAVAVVALAAVASV